MSFPVFVLSRKPNALVCGCLQTQNTMPSCKHFVITAPYEINSIFWDMANDFAYILGMGRKSLMFWKLSLPFVTGAHFQSDAVENFSSPQIERILTFNSDFSLAAVYLYSFQLFIYRISLKQLKVATVLDTAGQAVIDAKFHKNIPDIIIAVYQDRTFKIWNVSTNFLIYESHILTAASLSALDLSPTNAQLTMAFGNGMLIGHAVTATKPVSSSEIPGTLFQFDLRKKLNAFLRRTTPCSLVLQSLTTPPTIDEGGHRGSRNIFYSYIYPSTVDPDGDEVDVDSYVLSLFYFTKSMEIDSGLESLNIHGNKHYVSDIRKVAQNLLILLSNYIVQLNIANLEIEVVIELPDNVISGKFGSFQDTCDPYCVYNTSGATHIVLLNTETGSNTSVATAIQEGSAEISMVANVGLLATSVFRKAKLEPHKSKADKPPQLYKPVSQMFRQPGTLDKSGKIVDSQPITFHHKIKSSGYTASKPWAKKPLGRSHSSGPSSKPVKKLTSQASYPMTGPPPSQLTGVMALSERQLGATWLQPSCDGKWVAFAMTDGTVGVTSSKKLANPRMFVHHRQYVRRIGWSKCGSWLAVCSDDGTASFWSFATGECVFSLTDDNDRPFKKPVNHVQFYYSDQFALTAVGNCLNLYSCAFTNEKSDIKRYQVKSVARKAGSFQLDNAMTVSAIGAANGFHSYLAIAAGSDRSLQIFDFNVGRSIVTMEEAHLKPAHCIALAADAVTNAAVPHTVYNLYASIAVGDVVKLWDVRESKPIRCFQGHANRSCPFVSVAFSPCARFLATGSEDRAAYVFDIRTDRPLNRIEGGVDRAKSNSAIRHSETVTSVTFNPSEPQMFVSTLDGNLYRYSAPS